MTGTDVRSLDEKELGGILAQYADRDADDDLVLVRGSSWQGPPVVDSQVGPVRVVAVPSVLAAHAATVDHRDGLLVLVTPLEIGELGQELRARAWRNRVQRPSPWDAVRALFRVDAIDPSLRGRDWMVEQLVAMAPSNGYPQPVSQVLDLATAWEHVLRGLGLSSRPSGRDLLVWSTTSQAVGAVDRLDAAARTAIGRHLDAVVSPAGSVLVGLAGAGPGAVVLGLVAEALWPDPDPVARALFLDRHFKSLDLSLTDAAAQDLGRLAVDVVTAPGSSDVDVPGVQAEADRMLEDLDRHDTADSSVLARSFDRRVLDAMQAVRDLANLGSSATSSENVAERLDHARGHRLASQVASVRRLDAVEAALRLARRGRNPSPVDGPLAELAATYRDDGAWVDAAWYRLLDGDPADRVAAIHHELVETWAPWRRDRDRAFAATVATEAVNDPPAASLAQQAPLRIEQVLDTVVVPLAEHGPVLLLVIDGLSHAAAPPILADVAGLGWTPVRPVDHALPAVVAAIPSVTRVSRASLLSGTMTSGGQPVEVDGFTTHLGLVEVAGDRAPTIIHKKALRTSDGLTTPARDVISDPDHRVVGVVFNGVDDFLSTDGQLQLVEGLAGLPGLDQLFDAAADAGRTVILTSDHGHVLRSPRMEVVGGVGSGYGERYRIDDGDVRGGEVELAGSRVGEGAGRVVAAADGDLRYTPAAKHGYHGGATPAEMLAPLFVLTPPGVELEGWVADPLRAPAWWDPAAAAVKVDEPAPSPATRVTPPRRRAAPDTQLSLIAEDEPSDSTDWVQALLSSSQMATQRARTSSRATIDDGDLGQLLRLLVAGGGTVSSAALSRSLGLPESRLRGKLTAARSLLNVESYRVLTIEADGTAVLNSRLLAQQFGLEQAPLTA